jgi:hypothetical protein
LLAFRARATVAAVVVSTSLVPALALAPAAEAARAPGLLGCSRTIEVRPKTFSLKCGYSLIGLLHTRWSRFGGRTARGTATLWYTGCNPECVEGAQREVRVRVTASRVRRVLGKRSYTRISLTRTNGKPAGRYGIDAGGPHRLSSR